MGTSHSYPSCQLSSASHRDGRRLEGHGRYRDINKGRERYAFLLMCGAQTLKRVTCNCVHVHVYTHTAGMASLSPAGNMRKDNSGSHLQSAGEE